MEPPEKKRWLITEIPLWGLIMVLGSAAAWAINIHFEVKIQAAELAKYKSTHDSVSQMVWLMGTFKDDLTAIRSDMKTVAKLNLDVTILQNDLAALDCRTGGRCSGRNDRGHK